MNELTPGIIKCAHAAVATGELAYVMDTRPQWDCAAIC